MSRKKDDDPDVDGEISPIETNILSSTVDKLNFVLRNGSGTGLSEEAMTVFKYWLGKRRIRAADNARFGEIYEITGT